MVWRTLIIECIISVLKTKITIRIYPIFDPIASKQKHLSIMWFYVLVRTSFFFSSHSRRSLSCDWQMIWNFWHVTNSWWHLHGLQDDLHAYTKQQINTFVTNFRTKIQTTPCFLYLFNGFFSSFFLLYF